MNKYWSILVHSELKSHPKPNFSTGFSKKKKKFRVLIDKKVYDQASSL